MRSILHTFSSIERSREYKKLRYKFFTYQPLCPAIRVSYSQLSINLQGVIEILDQYFLKNTTPEDIKMHVVTTLSAASGKG